LATNNSSRNVSEYVARLDSLGVPVNDDNIVTSGLVTLIAMEKQYPPSTPIYVIGSDSLSGLLTSHGYVIDAEHAKVVVVGLDVKLNYDKLTTAGQRILDGADFIGTNADRSLPTQTGVALGCGSILAALESMTERAPRVMGKPEPIMFEVALERLHTAPERTLMIGDRLDTDIVGAQRAGLRAALVLTGVRARVEAETTPPDGIFDDLAALQAEWRRVVQPSIR